MKPTSLTYQEQLDILKSVFPDMETAGPDHWIYSEGAYTTFTGTSPSGVFTEPLEEVEPSAVITNIEPCEQNSLTLKIFKELKSEYLGYNHSLDASDVASLIELDDEDEEPSENITWVSSTWIEPRTVNLHLCTVIGEPDNVFATAHWDRGVLVEVNGPWKAIDDAKANYGFVKEGWSDLC